MLVELRAEGVGEEKFGEMELARLQFRLHLLDEMQVCNLRLRTVRVTGHRDVALAALLVERSEEFTLIQNPTLEVGERLALRRTRVELIEERGALGPVAEIDLRGHEGAWGVGRKICERQQIHWSRG